MKPQAENPILPLDEYIPDGEPHVFGDRIYLYGSHDSEGGERYCSLGDYVGWSAPVTDLTAWRREGVLYTAQQDPSARTGCEDLYAPDVVRGNDGRYYLYYVLSGPAGEGFSSTMGVAVCDTPAGRYEYLGVVQNPDGTPFNRYIVADPGLINDDGVIRLYYGWSLSSGAGAAHGRTETAGTVAVSYERLMQAQMMLFKRTREELESEPHPFMGANTVVLDDDMLTVVGEPARIVPGEFDAAGTSFEGHAFYEAASIRKIGSTYYFIYSSQLSHELCYATSQFPDRGFTYGGTIHSNGDVGLVGRAAEDRVNMTGNNHGSIERINGQWYVFYHRQTHNSTFSRQACAEPVVIAADGSIAQVPCTSSGLNGAPLAADRAYPAAIACNITNGRMPHATNRTVGADIPYVTHDASDRFITNIAEGTTVGYKYFAFEGPTTLALTSRGDGVGQFVVWADETRVGEVPVAASPSWTTTETTIDVDGAAALNLVFDGEGAVDLLTVGLAAQPTNQS